MKRTFQFLGAALLLLLALLAGRTLMLPAPLLSSVKRLPGRNLADVATGVVSQMC